MAETNGTTPPLFREALVQAGPWTMTDSWQRWLSAFWQQQQTLTQQAGQPHVLGTGAADKVGVWQDATTLTYDTLLHYDRTQHWLGIGTATPTAPLTFSNALGPKIDFYNVSPYRYGIGLQGGQLQIYADAGSQVRLGNMAADGVTFQPRFDVLPTYVYSSVPLGVMWGTVAGYELSTNRFVCAGVSYFGAAMGIAVPPGAYGLDVNGTFHASAAGRFESTLTVVGSVDAYNYCMMNSLRLGDHVAPGATLDVNGSAIVRGNLNVTAGGSSIVSGGGHLQVIGNYLYGDGNYGLMLQGAIATTPIIVRGLRGNPSWNDCFLDFHHYAGSHVSFVVNATGGANNMDFRLSGGNAYIAYGAWVDQPSDRRIKRGITPIDTPLERLAKLHGAHYERTDLVALEGFPAPQTHEYGLIAQDVAEALPEAAFEHDYGERGVLWNYYDRPVLALLVESVKALAQRVAALEGA